MLEKIFRDYPAVFRSLAENWLTSGTSGFCVMLPNKRMLAHYPSHVAPKRPELTCAIVWRGQEIGVLGVVGLQGRSTEKRLQQDSLWLSTLCDLEAESEHMAQLLLENQERMLALYEFSRIYKDNIDTKQFIESFLKFCAPVVGCQQGFALLAQTDMPIEVISIREQTYPTKFYQRIMQFSQNTSGAVLLPGADLPFEMPDDLHSLFFMPFKLDGQHTGGFGFYNHPQGVFTSGNVQLLQALGMQADAYLRILLSQFRTPGSREFGERTAVSRIWRQMNEYTPPTTPELDIAALKLAAPSDGAPSDGVPSDGSFHWVQANVNGDLQLAFGEVADDTLTGALYANTLLANLRSKIRHLRMPGPQLVIQRVVEDMQDNPAQNDVKTALFVASLHLAQSQLLYANAGVATIWHVSAQAIQSLGVATPNLRREHIAQITERSIRWQKGDYIIIASPAYQQADWKTADIHNWLVACLRPTAAAMCQALDAAFTSQFTVATTRNLLVLRFKI